MTYKVAHYINQFFAGVGGENAADFRPLIQAGPVGPGKQMETLFGGRAEISATLICGDNYFAVRPDEALAILGDALEEHKPDLIIAGPSFFAGRYGFACGRVIAEAGRRLGIPGVAGMSAESPAVEMFRGGMYIVETGGSAKTMRRALEGMTALAEKLLRGAPLGTAADEGYFHRNCRKNFFFGKNGGARAVDMLLAKIAGEPFVSEYIQKIPERVAIAPRVADLSAATVALLNTGGMVPAGNPDRIEGSAATKFGVYPTEGLDALEAGKIVSVHGGYDTTFSDADPNRIVPLDILREFEREGRIGKVHEFFYSTVGTGAPLATGEAFGRSIAGMLTAAGVDAAIMVST